MSGRIRLLLGIAGPPSVWAAHFIAVYALISAACAPRALLEPDVALLSALALTPVALALSIMPLLWPPGIASRELTRGIRWLSAISTTAVVFNLLPTLLVPACG